MEIILDKQYFENLNVYIGKEISFKNTENGIEFLNDLEIQYLLIKSTSNNYEFQTIERGKVTRCVEYHSTLEMHRRLALSLRGLFGKKIDYSKADLFKEIEVGDMKLLDELMNKFIGKEYYSIDDSQVWKINIAPAKQDTKYNIYLVLSNGNEILLENNVDGNRAFMRFYNEAVYLKETMQRINGYEEIFKDKLSSNDIDELLNS